jgi:hypothetical protein
MVALPPPQLQEVQLQVPVRVPAEAVIGGGREEAALRARITIPSRI